MEEKMPPKVKMAILILSNYCNDRCNKYGCYENACKTCPLRNRNTDETCGLLDEEVPYWYDNVRNMETT